MIGETSNRSLPQHQSHSRRWQQNRYVYPVVSRRSGGLSIGVNLNPDTACNFDCVYCQVDRSKEPRVRKVDPAELREELEALVDEATSARLFDDPAFAKVPAALRAVKDIAFSGDGEPTTCTRFRECVGIVADVKRSAGLDSTKIVLITDSCYLTRPEVEAGLTIMGSNNGVIWAKLDAGTQAYFQTVNRPNFPLQHVIDNIIASARRVVPGCRCPVVIQSLFMRINGKPPGELELEAYTDRLNEITSAGGELDHVQVYTIARAPAEAFVSPLTHDEVDRIAKLVRERTGLNVMAYYGPP